jgi:radical SAM superfamily enzyme YgiQ (UPF0313 family)
VLYGRLPRTKSGDQVVAELDALHRTGWRGHLFFVDDNFIGNRDKLKKDVLPRIIRWMEENGHPFSLGTEASLNLADDPQLLNLMVRAGFEEVFVGIESPNVESLEECRKTPNRNRDLISSIHTLQKAGLQVQRGFIVGFDNDPPSIFDSVIRSSRRAESPSPWSGCSMLPSTRDSMAGCLGRTGCFTCSRGTTPTSR